MISKILLILITILLSIIVTFIFYLIYALSLYKRNRDNIKLDISKTKKDKISQNGEYSIMSWNIGFGAYSQDYSFFSSGDRAYSKNEVIKNLREIYKIIQEYNPDFLFNQEVDIKGKRSYNINEIECLTKERETSYTFTENYNSSYYILYPLYCPIGSAQSGLLTQSKYNINKSIRKSLPVEKGIMKLVDLDRSYNISRILLDNNKELVIINLHLSAFTKNQKIPKEQLKLIANNLKEEKEKGNYVICGGDFNKNLADDTVEENDFYDKKSIFNQKIDESIIPDGFTLIKTYSNKNKTHTCRNVKTKYREGITKEATIDGFIVSDNIEIVQAKVIDTNYIYTDHNPIYMKFKIK